MAKNQSPDDFIDHDAMEDSSHPANEFIDKAGQAKLKKYLKAPQASELESAREGLAQGGTYGFAPRMGAALGATLSAPGEIQRGIQEAVSAKPGEDIETAPGQGAGGPQSVEQLYKDYLDYNNKLQAKAHASNPSIYNASMLAGGIASPLNKIGSVGALAQAAPKASILAKMAHSGAAGARMGGLAGLSQSQDLTDIPQDISNVGTGMAFGGGIGTVAPPITAGLAATARGGANVLKTVFGPVGQNFAKGIEAGAEGAPNIATEEGQQQTQAQRKEFAENFVNNLKNIIKKNAKNKVQMIEQHVADLPKDKIDGVLNTILELDPTKMGTKEAEEFALIKEEILRAKEGPMQAETVRQYNPGQAPAPVLTPNQQYRPPINPAEVMPPEGAPPGAPPPGMDVTPPPMQAIGPGQPGPPPAAPNSTPMQEMPGGQNLPVVQPPEIHGEASQMAPPPEPSPGGFQGYEALHKATIDADDKAAREAFEQKIHEKLADEEALGQNHNDNQVQIEEKKLPNGKVRLIAKRAISGEDADAFKEQAQGLGEQEKMSGAVDQQNQQAADEGFKQQAQDLNQQQKDQQRLQNLLDQQNEESARMKQQQEVEMAKPQFQDVEQQVRSGGRNIQNPKELYTLQQLMQEYGHPTAPRMQTQTMQRVAQGASKDLSGILKQNVGTSGVDAQLHAFNNIAEVLGVDASHLGAPGGTGEKAQNDAMNKLFKLINPENLNDQTLLNQDKLQYIDSQLRAIDPGIADQFIQNAAKQAENKGLMKEFTKPYEPSGINWLFNAVRKTASKTAYRAGYGLGEQGQKIGAEIGPAIQAGQKIFTQFTPDSLQQAATKAAASTDSTVQQFGQVMSKLATADERTRNSMLFILQQNAGYRDMMKDLLPPEEKKSTQSKDNTLQKFK